MCDIDKEIVFQEIDQIAVMQFYASATLVFYGARCFTTKKRNRRELTTRNCVAQCARAMLKSGGVAVPTRAGRCPVTSAFIGLLSVGSTAAEPENRAKWPWRT